MFSVMKVEPGFLSFRSAHVHAVCVDMRSYAAEVKPSTTNSILEAILSSLYVYYTYRLLRGTLIPQENARKVIRHLLVMNLFILALDATLLGTEFADHYELQTTYKSALYSVKLKVEFVVLNQLVDLVKSRRSGSLVSNTEDVDMGESGTSGAKTWNIFGRRWVPRYKEKISPGEWIGSRGVARPSRTYVVSASTTLPVSQRHNSEGCAEIVKTVDVDIDITQDSIGHRESIGDSEANSANDGAEREEFEYIRRGFPQGTGEKGKGPQGDASSIAPSFESDIDFLTGKQFLEDIPEVCHCHLWYKMNDLRYAKVVTPLSPRPGSRAMDE